MDRLLPVVVLADDLGRLPQRSLAVSRAVCKCLRDIIDDLSLLRADRLPLSLGKIFTNFEAMELSEFFSPVNDPAAISRSGLLGIIDDHCNGLVLIKYVDHYVMNPITLQGVLLPPPPPPSTEMKDFYQNGAKYLVFDPTVAPDYEVFLIPHVPGRDTLGLLSLELEWPPSPFILSVYSSTSKHWEQRPFVRKGDAIGSIGHILQSEKEREKHYGVYLRGALYVHCQNDYFYKISPSNGEYQVIKPPPGIETSNHRQVYLGKSRNERQDNLQVDGPWSSQEYYYDDAGHDHMKKAPQEYCYDYFSIHNEEGPAAEGTRLAFLGFHPFNKDVVFLTDTSEQGFAYHLESSTVEHLEKLNPMTESVYYNPRTFVEVSFPFTPCLTGELS
ncbi:uncharacterized protein [Triticum aestivum]|uniref:uncharacterized protein n=1 Tax=Triticum aestivum TaxID=4565 RepID=UPI001D02A3DD|nr:uncharacterized protein LOC123176981 [Triticum aestivum]